MISTTETFWTITLATPQRENGKSLPAYWGCGKSCEYLPVLIGENSVENLEGKEKESFKLPAFQL